LADLKLTKNLLSNSGPLLKKIFIFSLSNKRLMKWTLGLLLLLSINCGLLRSQDTIKVEADIPEQNAEKNYNSGLLEIGKNNFQGAIGLFSKCIIQKPDFESAFCNRAVAYTRLKQYSEALKDINKAISINAKNPEAFFNKNLIFFGMHLADSQEVALDHCLYLKPGHPEALYYKGVLSFGNGDFEKAIAYYSGAINAKPDFAYAYNDRASVKKAIKDYAGAIADYEKALAIDRSLVFVYNNLGTAYRLNKNRGKAIEAYSIAIEKDPSYLIALNNRGAAFFESDDYKMAEADFESLLKRDPQSSFAYNNLATIALKQKEYKKAKEMFSKSIQLDPANGPAYYNRGIASQMLHDEEGSCADWKKAVELGVDGAKTLINTSCPN
jgi:tetratricopeptide (TPR) repeat protein